MKHHLNGVRSDTPSASRNESMFGVCCCNVPNIVLDRWSLMSRCLTWLTMWVEYRSSVSLTLSLSADIVWINCIVPLSVSSVCPVASIDSLPAPRISVRMPVNLADGIVANALALFCSPVPWSPRSHKNLREGKAGLCFSLPAFEWSETKMVRNAVKETVRTAVQPSIWSQKFAHTWKSGSWTFDSRMRTMTIMKQFRQRKKPTPNFWRDLSFTFQSR